MLPFLEPGALAIVREPLPDASALAATKAAIQKKHSISSAKGRQLSELSKRLIDTAAEANDSAMQYAALDQAAALAGKAGDWDATLAAIDEQARWFEVDGFELKVEALNKAVTAPSTPKIAREIATHALTLSQQAQSADRADLARSFAEVAALAAKKVGDPALRKLAQARVQEASAAGEKSSQAAKGE